MTAESTPPSVLLRPPEPASSLPLPSTVPKTSWLTAQAREQWPLLALLIVGVLVPVAVGTVSGTLDIPRNDDWSYRRLAVTFFQTGRLELDSAAATFLLGQLLFVQPFLWLSSGQAWGFVVAGVVFQSVAVIAGYLTFRRILSRPLAALAILSLIFMPGYLPYAVSFMTDVPAIALEFTCLGLGMVALARRPLPWRWLALSLVVGLIGFTFRQFALVAPVAVALAAILAEPRRWRPWVATALLIVLAFALYRWRSSLAGQLGDVQTTTAWAYRLLLVASSLALVLLPATLVGWIRWRRRIHVVDLAIGTGVGFLILSGRLMELLSTGRLPQVLLDVNITQYGSPARMYITGGRPVLVADPIWSGLSILALVATIVVAAVAAGIIGSYVRAALKAPRSILPAFASPAGLLFMFLGGTIAGLIWYGFNFWIYDRYFWVLIPTVAALLMYRPRWAGEAADLAPVTEAPAADRLDKLGETPGRRLDNGLVVGLALVLVAILGTTSLAFLLNAAAFDAARWRAGQELVDRGISADTIDAGYEWVGYHATTPADFAHPALRLNWWQNVFPAFRMCGLIASGPQAIPGARLIGVELGAYKMLLFGGEEEPIYLYQVDDPACRR